MTRDQNMNVTISNVVSRLPLLILLILFLTACTSGGNSSDTSTQVLPDNVIGQQTFDTTTFE